MSKNAVAEDRERGELDHLFSRRCMDVKNGNLGVVKEDIFEWHNDWKGKANHISAIKEALEYLQEHEDHCDCEVGFMCHMHCVISTLKGALK